MRIEDTTIEVRFKCVSGTDEVRTSGNADNLCDYLNTWTMRKSRTMIKSVIVASSSQEYSEW